MYVCVCVCMYVCVCVGVRERCQSLSDPVRLFPTVRPVITGASVINRNPNTVTATVFRFEGIEEQRNLG